jgi:hypothetical protein
MRNNEVVETIWKYAKQSGLKEISGEKRGWPTIKAKEECQNMDSVLEELRDILTSTGMSQIEADQLLSRFLEEQAYDYVCCIELMRKGITPKVKKDTKHMN